MRLQPLFLLSALTALALGLSHPAIAGVGFPYQLDPTFSTDGYDTNNDAEIVRKVAYDGNNAIVAASKDLGDGSIEVRLYRYDANGNRQNWSASNSPVRVLSLYPYKLKTIKDMVVSQSSGKILLLLDKVAEAPNESETATMVTAIPLTGASGATPLRIEPQSGVANRNIGAQLALADDKLFVLYSHLDPDVPHLDTYNSTRNEFSVAKLVHSGTPNSNWFIDVTWGSNGLRSYSYEARMCVNNSTMQPTLCGLAATRMAFNANSSNAIWIAGNVTRDPWDTPAFYKNGVFLFKIDATTGNPDTSFGDQGWVSRKVTSDTTIERAGDLIVRERLSFFTGVTDADAFVLNQLKRPCGIGFFVTRYNNDGTYSNDPNVDNGRSWTHGGGSSGTNCDSIKANAMTFIPSGFSLNKPAPGTLAIVSQHTERVQIGGTAGSPIFGDRESAVLQTLNADELSHNLDQDKQFIFTGNPTLTGTTKRYGYSDVAWHAGLKRLMAVGNYDTSRARVPPPGTIETHEMLVSRLKEQPLFSDGFEGN